MNERTREDEHCGPHYGDRVKLQEVKDGREGKKVFSGHSMRENQHLWSSFP